ncbi:MAG: hypothetical protein HYR88_04395 [Verrucomicrobia bacterium]|nr:hypothetical protein [Verrucomicrobiota bacterium]MBI3868235.1 hypothetical protein [Verrucomicrobiota bacterium]
MKTKILRVAALAGAGFCLAATPPEPAPPPRVRQVGPDEFLVGDVRLDRSTRSLGFPAEVNLTDRVLEYALVTHQGKTHESLLRTAVDPKDVHVAALLLGAIASAELGDTNKTVRPPARSRVTVDIEWRSDGAQRTNRLEDWMGLGTKISQTLTNRLKRMDWIYTGSTVVQGHFIAQEEGSIISLIRDPGALINNPGVDRDDDDIHYADPERAAKKGTLVTVRLRFMTETDAEKSGSPPK